MRILIVSLATLLLYLVLSTTSYAEGDVKIEYSFESNHTQPVIAYEVYDDGTVLDVYVDTTGTIRIPCVEVPMGSSDFTMTAVYSDDTRSAKSEPFPFTVPKCEVLEVITITLDTNVN